MDFINQRQYFIPCRFAGDKEKFCYRWNCRRKECRDRKLWSESKRIMEGCKRLAQHHQMWFLTLNYINSEQQMLSEEEMLYDFQQRVTKFLKALRTQANRSAKAISYVRVNSIKSLNARVRFEPHAHIIISWIGDAIADPTPTHPHRHASDSLEEAATNIDLKVWTEKIANIEQVARYCAENLKSLSGKRTPKGFKRTTYSKDWYKMIYQLKRSTLHHKLAATDSSHIIDNTQAALEEALELSEQMTSIESMSS